MADRQLPTSRMTSTSTLSYLSGRAFEAYGDAMALMPEVVVKPAVPILFFGDLAQYRQSPLRIVIVGLNPSLFEFPTAEPFLRFPGAISVDRDGESMDPEQYLTALSSYFRTDPYRAWFRSYAGLALGTRLDVPQRRADGDLGARAGLPGATRRCS